RTAPPRSRQSPVSSDVVSCRSGVEPPSRRAPAGGGDPARGAVTGAAAFTATPAPAATGPAPARGAPVRFAEAPSRGAAPRPATSATAARPTRAHAIESAVRVKRRPADSAAAPLTRSASVREGERDEARVEDGVAGVRRLLQAVGPEVELLLLVDVLQAVAADEGGAADVDDHVVDEERAP